jgi:hypothetical protein
LVAADCGRLVDAVSVAVALALGAADTEGSLPSRSPELPESAGVEEQTANADAPPPARTAEAWLPSLSLWLVGDAGSLPDAGMGAALGAEIEWRKFQLRAVGTLLFEQQTRMAPTATARAPGAKLELFTGGVLGCTAPFASLRAPLAPLLCLGAELGRIGGVGTGVTAPRRGSALWVAPLVQVGGLWAIPGTSLRLGITLAAAAPLKRDAFTLRDVGTVYQPPNVVGRIGLGLDLGFD